jgi:hypothetical protein
VRHASLLQHRSKRRAHGGGVDRSGASIGRRPRRRRGAPRLRSVRGDGHGGGCLHRRTPLPLGSRPWRLSGDARSPLRVQDVDGRLAPAGMREGHAVRWHPLILWGAAILPVLAGCSAGTDRRLGQVEQRQSELDLRVAVDERRAADLRADALQLQYLLEAQRRCVAWEECHARFTRIQAEITAKLAECNKNSAIWYACDARRARDTAADAGLGCLFGWVVAGVTGGAAAPAVVIGCGAGAAAGDSGSKGPCTSQPKPKPCGNLGRVFEVEALAVLGLPSTPDCGEMPEECALLNFSSR